MLPPERIIMVLPTVTVEEFRKWVNNASDEAIQLFLDIEVQVENSKIIEAFPGTDLSNYLKGTPTS